MNDTIELVSKESFGLKRISVFEQSNEICAVVIDHNYEEVTVYSPCGQELSQYCYYAMDDEDTVIEYAIQVARART